MWGCEDEKGLLVDKMMRNKREQCLDSRASYKHDVYT